jgi:hypothetical protein
MEVRHTEGGLGVRLVPELNDRRTEEIIVRQPKGHPDAPWSDAELLEIMTWLVETAAPPLAALRLLGLCIASLPFEDVEGLIESCRVQKT